MTTLRTHAPAKVNLGLEVLGTRADGYHDIVTLAQPIALYDDVSCTPADDLAVATEPPLVGEGENLVGVAARALAAALGRPAEVRFAVTKRVPLAAGLGGGSSDAAATLRLLARLWSVDGGSIDGGSVDGGSVDGGSVDGGSVEHATGAGLEHATAIVVERVAEAVGSDVPLFLRGGAVLVSGRGERVEAVTGGRPFWVALACPEFDVPEKTRALYAALTPADRTDGRVTSELAARLGASAGLLPTADSGAATDPPDRLAATAPPGGAPLSMEGRRFANAFDRAASVVYPDFGPLRRRLEEAAGAPLSLSGAGPSLYATFDAEPPARAAAARMAALGVRTYAAAALAAAPPIEQIAPPPSPLPHAGEGRGDAGGLW